MYQLKLGATKGTNPCKHLMFTAINQNKEDNIQNKVYRKK